MDRNLELVEALRVVAENKGVTVAQIADDMSRIEQAIPSNSAATDHYSKPQMDLLDSEKK